MATALNNMALLYEAQGRYGEAEPLYKRSLAIREKALGPEHPDVATSLDSLAVLSLDLGDDERALDFIRRSISISRSRALRTGGQSESQAKEQQSKRYDFIFHVRSALSMPGNGSDALTVKAQKENAKIMDFSKKASKAIAEKLANLSSPGTEHSDVARSIAADFAAMREIAAPALLDKPFTLSVRPTRPQVRLTSTGPRPGCMSTHRTDPTSPAPSAFPRSQPRGQLPTASAYGPGPPARSSDLCAGGGLGQAASPLLWAATPVALLHHSDLLP